MSERLYAESVKIFSDVRFGYGTERAATEDDRQRRAAARTGKAV